MFFAQEGIEWALLATTRAWDFMGFFFIYCGDVTAVSGVPVPRT